MHVSGVNLDLYWFLQLLLTVFVIIFGILHLVKNTASKYFEVDANFEAGGREGEVSDPNPMPGVLMEDAVCVVCGNSGSKKCSGCKAVRYCSPNCQEVHWKSGHKKQCKVLQSSNKVNSTDSAIVNRGFKSSAGGSKTFSAIALVPAFGASKPIKPPKEILYPYDEFMKLFYWDKRKYPPCGLLNCGNSCFANVVLQCLSFSRPLVAYLLEKGHRSECIRNDWCFLCEFQTHVERASRSSQPFSPNNIISRLPNIGGNLGYGRQEDAHEFMRFAIDTMQLVCLDEFGGEKALHPRSQETTIVQHIFGGHLQSQVICTSCNNMSNQFENMMDLTVEIHGDAASLEECLDQFTTMEWLHGDNMYKCDGCNDYVKASKCLTIKQAPNLLTIALKRFQSGRFGKLNKKVSFPETLDLSPYMSEAGDGTNVYKLYAVVVHVDMLNASYFGHYICYVKDFYGNWYRIDDCKVVNVELEEVLSQGAYMILYSRVCPRPSSLRAIEPSKTDEVQAVNVETKACLKEKLECPAQVEILHLDASSIEKESSKIHPESTTHFKDMDVVRINLSTSNVVSDSDATMENADDDIDLPDSHTSSSLLSRSERDSPVGLEDPSDRNMVTTKIWPTVSTEIARGETDSFGSNCEDVRKDSKDTTTVYGNGHCHVKKIEIYENGQYTDGVASLVNNTKEVVPNHEVPAEVHKMKHNLSQNNGGMKME